MPSAHKNNENTNVSRAPGNAAAKQTPPDVLTIAPIARIKNDFKEKFGIPRQSGRARTLSEIVFLPPYDVPEAVRKIEGFSHLWLIFGFSLNEAFAIAADESDESARKFSPLVRPPRLGGNEKAGVFATRSPFRPNPLGLSCVRLEKVLIRRETGVSLLVSGADLADGTPIYDIKPYLPSADKIENASGGFSEKTTAYALRVDFPERLLEKIPAEKRDGLIDCLKDDPRPAYQSDPKRIYGMRFASFNVRFKIADGTLFVIDVAAD